MPRQVYKALADEERKVWGFPLLIIALALLLKTLASGWVRQMTYITPPMPMEFQYYLPEEQERLIRALELTNGPLFVYVFPYIGGILGLLLHWLILSGFIRTCLRLLRDKSRGVLIRNITAWASLPFGLRYIIQTMYIILAGRQITQTGLANLASPGDLLALSFFGSLDFYQLWQVVLLIIGNKYAARVPLWKNVPAVILSTLIVLVLSAVVSMGLGILSGMLSG